MREFKSMGDFAQFLGAMPAKLERVGNLGLRAAAGVIQYEAQHEIGTYQAQAGSYPAWPQLAERTQRERVALGFTPNDPLLRTGELADSIGITTTFNEAVVGSDKDEAVYQELGTRHIPPRSFLGRAAFRKAATAVEVIAGSVVVVLAGLRRRPTMMDLEGMAADSVRDIPF